MSSKNDKKQKDTIYVQRFSGEGHLAEAVLVAGVPYFLVREKGKLTYKELIEGQDKIIRPPPTEAYLNRPYSFSSVNELDAYLSKVVPDTLDSLYQKVKSIWKKYVDAEDFHISICAADTIFTYFQDRLGLTHYLFFVGAPGSGKSNRLKVLNLLGYRNMMSSDMTPANIYQFLGFREEGIGTICEDEADDLDLNPEKMKIYKNGYTTGQPVLRMDNDNSGRVQYRFFTFGFKAFAAEKLPDSVKARGLLQRVIELPCIYGFPQYDIMEVTNPAGAEKFARLLDELEEARNLLLVYRMNHFHEKISDIKLNIINRESQLFKPILRVFQKTDTVNELRPVISEYINKKRTANTNSLHAYIYKIITYLIKNEGSYELESKKIWDAITGSNSNTALEGSFINNKPLSYESVAYATISQKGITEICKDVFSAVPPRRHGSSNKLKFDRMKLKQLKHFYNLSLSVKVKENGEDGEDGEDIGNVGLDKLLSNSTKGKRKSSTKNTGPDPNNLSHPSHPSQEGAPQG